MENTNQQILVPAPEKKRVYEIAKELRTTSKRLIEYYDTGPSKERIERNRWVAALT